MASISVLNWGKWEACRSVCDAGKFSFIEKGFENKSNNFNINEKAKQRTCVKWKKDLKHKEKKISLLKIRRIWFGWLGYYRMIRIWSYDKGDMHRR